MRITDNNGEAINKQYRVIKSQGQWRLVVDIHVVGDKATHVFRIQRLTNDIEIYPGAPIEYAMKRFEEVCT